MRCTVCGYFGEFQEHNKRLERCPKCRSVKRHRNFLKVVLKEITPCKCLEISTHHYTEILKKFGCQVTQINFQKMNGITQMDATDMAFYDNEFDLVLLEATLEHIQEYKKALSEIYRVLRKKGKLIIYVPFFCSQKNEKKEEVIKFTIDNKEYSTIHYWRFGYELVEDLVKLGFKVRMDGDHIIAIK